MEKIISASPVKNELLAKVKEKRTSAYNKTKEG